MRAGRDNGMTPFRAGVLALVVLALFAYFGFSKVEPVLRTRTSSRPSSTTRTT